MKYKIPDSYIFQAITEERLLQIALVLAKDTHYQKPLLAALEGLLRINRFRDSLIFASSSLK